MTRFRIYWPAVLALAFCLLFWAGAAAFVVKRMQPISDAVATVPR